MTSYSRLPVNAVVAGHDVDGSTIYVGRAHYAGDLIPAKAIPNKHVAYVAHGGFEHAVHDYQVRSGNKNR